jgi:hypothetical protein
MGELTDEAGAELWNGIRAAVRAKTEEHNERFRNDQIEYLKDTDRVISLSRMITFGVGRELRIELLLEPRTHAAVECRVYPLPKRSSRGYSPAGPAKAFQIRPPSEASGAARLLNRRDASHSDPISVAGVAEEVMNLLLRART